jgi:hypothetical protein
MKQDEVVQMVDFVINKMFVQFDGLVFQCVCSATRLFVSTCLLGRIPLRTSQE